MLSRSNGLILALAVLAAALGGYVEHRQLAPSQEPDATLIGQPAPAVVLADLDGKPHRLSDYRGRRVLLNFWASWCGPCLTEMPALVRAQAKFGEHGPIVVGIAMDDAARTRAFVTAHPLNYPILLGRLEAPSTSVTLGDSRAVLPYSVLIGADGRVLATHTGALPSATLEQWLGAR